LKCTCAHARATPGGGFVWAALLFVK